MGDDGNSTDSNEEEASEEVGGAEESQESENDTDSGSGESANSDSENTTIIQSNIPCEHFEGSNVYETILRCSKCSWHDTHSICPICDFNIPLKMKKNGREGFPRCYVCGAIKHKNGKTSKITYYPPSSDEGEDDYQTVVY